MNTRTSSGLAGLAIALSLGFASLADAATLERKIVQNPTGVCDALIPASDPDLRRQPGAIKNISPTNANVVVNCSLFSDEFGGDPNQVFVYFTNDAATNKTVVCTLHSSTLYYGITTINKSFVLTPGQRSFLSWSAADLPDGDKTTNLSCVLAKGVYMHDIGMRYNEGIGT